MIDPDGFVWWKFALLCILVFVLAECVRWVLKKLGLD